MAYLVALGAGRREALDAGVAAAGWARRSLAAGASICPSASSRWPSSTAPPAPSWRASAPRKRPSPGCETAAPACSTAATAGVYRLDEKAVSGHAEELQLPRRAAAQVGAAGLLVGRLQRRRSPATPPTIATACSGSSPRSGWASSMTPWSCTTTASSSPSTRACGPASRAALRWVYNYPRQDVVASELAGQALVMVTVDGHVVVVDPRVGRAGRAEGSEARRAGGDLRRRGLRRAGDRRGEVATSARRSPR